MLRHEISSWLITGQGENFKMCVYNQTTLSHANTTPCLPMPQIFVERLYQKVATCEDNLVASQAAHEFGKIQMGMEAAKLEVFWISSACLFRLVFRLIRTAENRKAKMAEWPKCKKAENAKYANQIFQQGRRILMKGQKKRGKRKFQWIFIQRENYVHVWRKLIIFLSKIPEFSFSGY